MKAPKRVVRLVFLALVGSLFVSHGAAQPPTVTEETKLIATDGSANDRFGAYVDVQGTTAVVGNDGDSNAAYIFERLGGVWIQQQKLTPGDDDSESFGQAVAIGRDTIAVGSPGEAGAVYVFVRTLTVWALQQKLVPNDEGIRGFGLSVAISPRGIGGDTIVVGSSQEASSTAKPVYVFGQSEDGRWVEQQRLGVGDPSSDGLSGKSVAISCYIVVGPYVFRFDRDDEVWVEHQELITSDGGIITASAASSDNIVSSSNGGAYVFARNANESCNGDELFFAEFQKLTPSDADGTSIGFGEFVDIRDNTIAVTAKDDNENGTSTGSVYIFAREDDPPAELFSESLKFIASDPQVGDQLGRSVAITQGLSGAPRAVISGSARKNENTGTVYLFEPANRAFFTVTSLADSGPGTLREAMESANNLPFDEFDGAVITFADEAKAGTIELESSLPDTFNFRNIAILGTGSSHLIISGPRDGTTFPSSPETLKGIRIENSDVAIVVGDESFSASDVIISKANTAIENDAGFGDARIDLFRVSIADGISGIEGGTGRARGLLRIVDSTITGNTGLALSGPCDIELVNSTVAGNGVGLRLPQFGGDDRECRPLGTIANSTIADNRQVGIDGGQSGEELRVTNSVVARNGQDCVGNVVSEGNNLFGDPSGCPGILQPTDLVGDPGFGAFIDPGIAGQGRIPLLSASQAIDSANDAVCLDRDQLGTARVGDCDRGAVEFYPLINDSLSLDDATTSLDRSTQPNAPVGVFTISATFTNASGEAIENPYFEVATLSGDAVLLNAYGGSGGVGARIQSTAGDDKIWSPGESVEVMFEIGLQTLEPFQFFVDVYGAVDGSPI